MTPQTKSTDTIPLDTDGRLDTDLPCRCGYNLRGIDPDRDCPECGLPVAASFPEDGPIRMNPILHVILWIGGFVGVWFFGLVAGMWAGFGSPDPEVALFVVPFTAIMGACYTAATVGILAWWLGARLPSRFAMLVAVAIPCVCPLYIADVAMNHGRPDHAWQAWALIVGTLVTVAALVAVGRTIARRANEFSRRAIVWSIAGLSLGVLLFPIFCGPEIAGDWEDVGTYATNWAIGVLPGATMIGALFGAWLHK